LLAAGVCFGVSKIITLFGAKVPFLGLIIAAAHFNIESGGISVIATKDGSPTSMARIPSDASRMPDALSTRPRQAHPSLFRATLRISWRSRKH